MQEKIIKLIQEATGIAAPVVFTEDFKNGDFASPVAFAIAKEKKENPKKVAEDIISKINKPDFIDKIEVAGAGYINFYLSPEYIANKIKAIDKSFGKNDTYKDKKIMVEYTNPNPFKIFHIGHLMNNAIGESFARLIEYGGAQVVRDCYQGDIGLHVAKTMWAVLADKDNFQNTVPYWGAAYIAGNNAYEDNKEAIAALNKKIFDKSDPEINSYYEKGLALSLQYFEEIYRKLDTKFDVYFLESAVAQDGIRMVEAHPEIFEKSEGATVYKGSHTRVFLNSQGLPTYEAKELGLTFKKYSEYKLDSSLVITGNEQNDYFKVVKEALSKIDQKYQIQQFGHGMLRFADGKMSSRKGNIVSAVDLLTDVEQVIDQKIQDSAIKEIIAIGAIKYSILRQSVGGDVIYDREKSISFEGDSGPYLQYACVRAKAILAKADSAVITDQKVGTLDRLLVRFPDIVKRAQLEFAPHYIVTYLTALASEFNAFYAHNKILDAGEDTGYRLALTRAFLSTMENGLYILAIKVPERM